MYRFTQFFGSFVLAITVFSLSAAPAKSKTIHVAASSNIISLDPHIGYDWLSYNLLTPICGNLVALSGGGTTVSNEMAQNITYLDEGKTLVIKIRENERFHDGSFVRATDVVHSLNRATSSALNSPGAAMFASVTGYDAYRDGKTTSLAGIKEIDEFTVQISLTRPSRSFLLVLATNFGCILPKTTPLHEIDHPISSGLFKFNGFKPDGTMSLSNTHSRPQTYYFSHIDDIILHPNIHPKDAVSGFSLGEYDVIWNPVDWGPISPMDGSGKVENSRKLPNLSGSTTYLSLNTRSGPLSDIRVRKAINFAVNRSKIERLLNNSVTQTAQIPPPQFPEFIEGKDKYPFSPNRARDLIAQTPYKDGIYVDLYSLDSHVYKKIVQSIMDDLESVNIHVTSYFGSLEQVLEAANTDGPGQIIFSAGLGWSADFPDAANFYYPLFSAESIIDGGWNWAGYDNPKVAQMANAADGIFDLSKTAEHTKAWRQVFDQIEEDAPWVPLYNRRSHFFFLKSIFENDTPSDTNIILKPNATTASSFLFKLMVDGS